jgi:hypothetical protein
MITPDFYHGLATGILLGGGVGLAAGAFVMGIIGGAGRADDQSRMAKYLDEMKEKYDDFTDPETLPPSTEHPSGWWWCQTCGEWIAPEAVLFNENHDERVGGCGNRVTIERPISPVASGGNQPVTGTYQKSVGNDCAGGMKGA